MKRKVWAGILVVLAFSFIAATLYWKRYQIKMDADTSFYIMNGKCSQRQPDGGVLYGYIPVTDESQKERIVAFIRSLDHRKNTELLKIGYGSCVEQIVISTGKIKYSVHLLTQGQDEKLRYCIVTEIEEDQPGPWKNWFCLPRNEDLFDEMLQMITEQDQGIIWGEIPW